AKVADGILVNWSNTEMLRKSLEFMGSDSRPGLKRAAYLITSVHDDEAKAWKTVVPYAAYLMVGASEKHIERAGVSSSYRETVAQVLARHDWEQLYSIADRSWVAFFSFWGNARKLEELVQEIIEMGYDEVVFAGPLGPRYVKALKSIASVSRSVRRRL
ncbi:MAG: hypothetical protein NZ941_01540, partial [Candidatus Caldarchaeum sp.]|nr:hypothetical protein [Candidatus Caldarchaeum sp.]